MPTPWRRRVRLAQRGFWYAVAVVLVCMALVLGLASQLLPMVERHPDKVAAWLSERAGRPVAFDHVETAWSRRGPLLRLDGLRIGERGEVRIGEAEVLVSMYGGLLPGRSFTELRLRGLSLTLQRAADGAWSVRGLPAQAGGGDPLDSLDGLGELQVIGGRLAIDAPELGWNTQLADIDLRLRVDDQRVRAGARVRAREGGQPLLAAVDFDRGRGDGKAFLQADPADLSEWGELSRYAGVQVAGGSGRVGAWLRLHRHRVVMVDSELHLRDVDLLGQPYPGSGDIAPSARFAQINGRLRWRLAAGGWRLDAPQLRMGDAAAPQQLDGLVLAGGDRYGIVAKGIDAGPLLSVLALSDRIEVPVRRWLAGAQPDAHFSDLSLLGSGVGGVSVQGHLDRVRFVAADGAPGIDGLSGELTGDADGFALQLDTQAPLRFDWPDGFGVVHDVTLAGQLAGWREGAGWRIGTPALRVTGADYGAELRGSLWFEGDASRPRIDVAAALDDAPVTAAKGFWIHRRMPQKAIDWLNATLAGGEVIGGYGLISGDLDDWPFVDARGRFEARAHIRNGQFKFNPDWPALEQADADVAFIGNGFSIQGTGRLDTVGVDGFEAQIADFREGRLLIDAHAQDDAARLLELLRHSPLKARYGETFANLEVAGPVRASFHLQQPLRSQGNVRRLLHGTVDLLGASANEKRWNLPLREVRGVLEYARDGVAADRLDVRYDGRPGTLGLRIGNRVRDAAQAVEIDLGIAAGSDELLDRAAELAWLKPYFRGRSHWNIGIAVPATRNGVQAPARLQLDSDLVGTAVGLPEPLRKPEAQALATRITAAMPLESGEVQVAFGQRLALRTRANGSQRGVRVALGSDSVAEAPPASGLVASGHAGVLDAIGWMALASQNRGQPGASLPLRNVDIGADRLQLAGGEFADTRLKLSPAVGGVTVGFVGSSLAGNLQVPDAQGATISGRLSKLHWPLAARGESAAGGDGADYDPAAVPPLDLRVDDLQVGDAILGAAELQTRPVAGGMHIESLHLHSPHHDTRVSGDWIGRGAAARTRLTLATRSQDFGGLFDDLGMKGRLKGGQGSIDFDASWPGSPGGFALASLQGGIGIDARDGQLLQVEPGAGRVLGLLSVAQLPRRMLLDFRDLFDTGFAYNHIEGKLAFGDGQARSDGLRIDGPAAEIRIHGSADLRNQQFDQTVDVFPKSGNLLAVVGAVAGGPVGAAVGAAANAVLKKPLGEIGAKTYRVTGPWKEPKVEVISREQSRTQTAAPSRPSGVP
ncbi:TIGR02099 family protein [Pseudoxanthomonas kalamensis DSM 18571]|uniref:YhdP family protein n=1 Tax=Pseudoxanthomonas kalamensis TaxID=289483 RepID=UPI001390DC9B|nr:YhdP family protein [Pseudoxanthomonas kalamensis]KAF1710366.1 TIGR02099 family protein [Pseudoxanthomonas kalamensis DSM 18571]